MRERPDEELLARTRAGDGTALEALFHRYYRPLCRLVDGYIHFPASAEEIVQTLFLRVWQQRKTWTVRDTVRVYLYAAARRGALDFLKHERVVRRFERAATTDRSTWEVFGRSVSADTRVEAAEQVAVLRQVADTLPERHRTVLLLRAERQLTVPAIARALGIPTKTAETRVARAVRAARAVVTRGAG